MGFVFKMRVVAFLGVPVFLHLAQGGDDAGGRVNRIGPFAHFAHMDGYAAHLHLKPDDAGVGADQHFLFGFGDEDRIGGVAL